MLVLKSIIKVARPHQWLKNLLVFLPFFAYSTIDNITNSFIGLISFCLCASAVYIYNDLKDYKQDQQHPTKSKRPIASGELSRKVASILYIVLTTLSLCFAYFLISHKAFTYILSYLLLNLFYTHYFKHIPILDNTCIATGFVLRLALGFACIHQPVNIYLSLFIFLTCMSLAFMKRLNELVNVVHSTNRKSLNGFTPISLNASIVLFSTLALNYYNQWISSFLPQFEWSSIPIILLIVLLLKDANEGLNEDLSKAILKKPVYLGLSLLWLLIFIILVPIKLLN